MRTIETSYERAVGMTDARVIASVRGGSQDGHSVILRHNPSFSMWENYNRAAHLLAAKLGWREGEYTTEGKI